MWLGKHQAEPSTGNHTGPRPREVCSALKPGRRGAPRLQRRRAGRGRSRDRGFSAGGGHRLMRKVEWNVGGQVGTRSEGLESPLP